MERREVPRSVRRGLLLDIAASSDEGDNRLSLDVSALACLARVKPARVVVHGPSGAGRPRVEAFLEGVYAQAFDGHIRRHYPQLMSLEDDSGAILAAAGFRFAEHQPLYLEHYLDRSAEREIAEATAGSVARRQVVEIGNLASTGDGAAVILFLALARHLGDLGLAFAIVTATRPLRRILRRAGFEAIELAKADPGRLPDGGADWGRYYGSDPVVMAGSIPGAFDRFMRLRTGADRRCAGAGLRGAFA